MPNHALWGTRQPGDPLYDDFRVFLWHIWQLINLPDPTFLQYDIAKYLQHGPMKMCIEAFRGVGKSFITSAFVMWTLYRDPQLKIMVVSASKNRADNFVSFCMQLLGVVPELTFLKPKPSQRQSRVEFDVGPALADQTPSVFAKGIDSQLTGGRADIIISDDVEVMNNSLTVDMRDKLRDKTKEFSAILKPLEAARIIYLGTPQTEESIYNELPSTFAKRIWPAQVPAGAEEAVVYGNDLAPMVMEMFTAGKFGEPTDPARFDMDDLMDRKAEYGAAGYQLQFMLNTRLSDEERFPLKLKNLVLAEVPTTKAPLEVFWLPSPDRADKHLPRNGMAGDYWYRAAGFGSQFAEYQHRAMSIDPSGRGADETSYAVGFNLASNIWIPAAGGLPGGYEPETLEFLAKLAKKHKVQTIVIESNFGDGMFARLLTPYLTKAGVTAEIVDARHHTMKEMRILDTLEPVISGHRLIVDPAVVEEDDRSTLKYDAQARLHKSLFHQMTHICREKGALRFDDRIDALAILVAHFVEIMDQSPENLANDQWEQFRLAEIERLHGSVLHLQEPDDSMSWNARI